MNERLQANVAKIGISLLCGTMMLAGCSKEPNSQPKSKSDTKSDLPVCTALNPQNWEKLDPGVVPSELARAMDVSYGDALEAKIGGANCDQPFTAEQIEAIDARHALRVSVKGFSGHCIVAGALNGGLPLQHSKTYTEVEVICAPGLV